MHLAAQMCFERGSCNIYVLNVDEIKFPCPLLVLVCGGVVVLILN